LVNGDCVYSGHETFLNTPVVIDNLGDGSKAVGGARGVGDDGLVTRVLLIVYSVHIDGSVVLRRCRHDDLLGTAVDVELSLLLGEVDTSAVSNVLTAGGTPLNLGGILLLEDLDLLTVDFNATFDLLDCAIEAT
jgi:hypothetical protein